MFLQKSKVKSDRRHHDEAKCIPSIFQNYKSIASHRIAVEWGWCTRRCQSGERAKKSPCWWWPVRRHIGSRAAYPSQRVAFLRVAKPPDLSFSPHHNNISPHHPQRLYDHHRTLYWASTALHACFTPCFAHLSALHCLLSHGGVRFPPWQVLGPTSRHLAAPNSLTRHHLARFHFRFFHSFAYPLHSYLS
jgi:hypothetical protein